MKKLLPYVLLTLLVGIVGVTNYVPNTFLTGWDNLQVELNPWINIQRALFTAWQEYQGPGLAGGMGHAADLFRQIAILPLYLILKQEHIRFVWTILTLLFGSIGMYIFCTKLFSLLTPSPAWKHVHIQRIAHFLPVPTAHQSIPIASFLAAVFYVFNLATLQTYYTPFEVFTSHFAALPWVLLATILYLISQSKKHFFYLILALFINTPSGYVPTVFLVYAMAAGILALAIRPLFPLRDLLHNMLVIGKLFAIIFVMNAFWVLPFSYFTITSSSINVNGKINQMSTENIFAMNKEYGTIPDVMLLKGFWFQSTEPNQSGTYQFVLGPWREHLANPFITAIGFFFFAIISFGVIAAIIQRQKILFPLALLFLFCITMLLTNTPPFSWIDLILRDYIPLFGQVFRFPFTKFSLITAAIYAVFFAYGLAVLLMMLQKLLHTYSSKIVSYGIALIVFSLMMLFMQPLFSGNLFYEREQIKIPQQYFSLFDFFKHQDPQTRIANFPQPNFWGWNFYNWNYSGSGFLWYGIKQPILDRAFDVWSNISENYYYEVSHAVYTKDARLLENVFQKYHVSWIILDKNLLNPSSPKALFVPEFESLLTQIPSIKKEKTFENITVFKVTLRDTPSGFVYKTASLPKVNTYTWSNMDQAYQTFYNYIATPYAADIIHPFHSLFSLKTQKEKEFSLTQQEKTITLSKTVTTKKPMTVIIPSLQETEPVLPVTFTTQAINGNIQIDILYQTPQVMIDKKSSWEALHLQTIFTIPQADKAKKLTLNINGTNNYPIPKETKALGTTLLSTTQDNILTLTDGAGGKQTAVITAAYLSSLPFMKTQRIFLERAGNHTITVTIPKVSGSSNSFKTVATRMLTKIQKCDLFRPGKVQASLYYEENADGALIESNNATACVSLYTPNLSHDYGYAVFAKSKNITGRPLHMWIENIDQHSVPLDTYLSPKHTSTTDSFILSPQEKYGNYYSIHIENISVGTDDTKNVLSEIAMYPIPFTFITGISVSSDTLHLEKTIGEGKNLFVSHPNESLYRVSGIKSGDTLVLSQAYNPGWFAYTVPKTTNGIIQSVYVSLPFLFGTPVSEHVMINNWENGWVISDSKMEQKDVIMVYLPQYLEYAGLGLLAFVFLLILRMIVQKKRQ